jgi:dolichol-phosphate mannosyltransferase
MSGAEGPGVAPGRSPTVSIILATLNERQSLPPLVERICRQPLPPFELIVVDDGSTDGTREYLKDAAEKDRRIRLIFHEGKQTTLRAQCQGLAASSGQYLIIMDADLQHPPEVLSAIVERLKEGQALVVASRYAPGGSAGPRTISRWAISRGAEWTAKFFLASARRVSDPVSGYFGFRRETWVPLNPLYRGYKLLLFVLVMAEGKPVAEVGFRFEPRAEGASKVTESSSFIRMFLVETLLARRLAKALRSRPTAGTREQLL